VGKVREKGSLITLKQRHERWVKWQQPLFVTFSMHMKGFTVEIDLLPGDIDLFLTAQTRACE
jgi:hypothetical protein